MKRIVTAAAAAALSLSLAGLPALAQVELAEDVITKLEMLGFDMNDVVVTEEQVLELENVLNSDETDETKRMQVEEIIGG